MKKSFKLFLFLGLVFTFVCFLTSCVEVIYDGKNLAYDDENHWYVCDCGNIMNVTPHDFSKAGDVLTNPSCERVGTQMYYCECGHYTIVELAALGHKHSEEYTYDEESHWNQCFCGDRANVTAHVFDIPGEVLSESTCSVAGSQVYSCVCGAQTEKALPLKDHVYGEELSHDDVNHWNACECGAKNNEAAHEYTIPGEVTVAPKCTVAGKQLFACVCGASKELEIPSLGGHVDADLDIVCDNEGCTTKVAPAGDTEISLFTANQIGKLVSTSRKYYVEGVVSQVLDAKNGIFYIQDENEVEFYFRLPKDANGNTHFNWEQKIVLGDTVRLYGAINKFSSSSGSIPAMQGPVVVELQHEHQYSDATCTEVSACRCGLTQGELLPHEDLNGDELCDVCGFNVNLKIFETPIVTLDGDPNSGVLEGKEKRTWTYDVFTLVVEKGTASDIYVTKDKFMKVKKNNVVTLTANGDKKFTQIEFTSTSSTYAKSLNQSISKLTGVKVETVDTLTVVVTFDEPVSELSFVSTATTRFGNIKVIY